jgi:CMP-N,N'-diacetyllegionaminic acid synthase
MLIKNIKKHLLCTICAKINSKGLKGKNIKILGGYPIIYYAIKKAKDSKLKNICLATDSIKIQKIANKFGVKSFYKRSKNLSKQNIPKLDVWKDAIIKSEKFYRRKFKFLLDIEVTNPLTSSRDLENFLDFSTKVLNKVDGIFCVMPSRRNPYFNIFLKKKNGYRLCIHEKKRNIFSRQKAPTTYDHVGGFYLFKINYLKKCKNFLNGKTAGYMLPFGKNIDIDDINDFKLAKLFFENKYYRKKNYKFYNR